MSPVRMASPSLSVSQAASECCRPAIPRSLASLRGLALSATDALGLAPLADRWLEHGVAEQEARSLLTAGLPPVVHCARAFLTNRLTRKLPPHRTRPQTSQAAAPLAECIHCRDPLPRGRQATTCTRCTGTATTPAAATNTAATSTQVAVLRRALRNTPSAAPSSA